LAPEASIAEDSKGAVEDTTAPASRPSPRGKRRGGIPAASVVLGSVAAAGLVAFISFEVAGDEEQRCSPTCQPGQTHTANVEHAVAIVSGITGLVALGGAVTFWLLRPPPPIEVQPSKMATLRFEARPVRGGATLGLWGTF
jgi:hypothetical protein